MPKGQPLNHRWEAFAREYLVDFHAHRAALAAGYSPKSAAAQASALLKNPKFQELLARLTAEKMRDTDASAEAMIKNLWAMHHAKLDDLGHWEEGGVLRIKPSDELPFGIRKAVKKITNVTTVRHFGDGMGSESKTTTTVELHDPVAAGKLLAQLAGWEPAKRMDLNVNSLGDLIGSVGRLPPPPPPGEDD